MALTSPRLLLQVTGLAQAYAAHMPALWQHAVEHMTSLGVSKTASVRPAPSSGGALTAPALASSPPYAPTSWEASVVAKLGALPLAVLSVYEHPEHDLRVRVIQLLDHVMLPETLSDSVRAWGALSVYATLDESGRRVFRLIQLERRSVQAGMREFLAAREASRHVDVRANGGAADRAARERLRVAINTLAERSGHAAKGMAALWTLAQVVQDKRVFSALAVLCNPCSSSSAILLARDDLQARLKTIVSAGCAAVDKGPAKGRGGTASSESDGGTGADMKALADTVRTLLRKMCMGTVSASMLHHVISAAVSSVATGEVALGLQALALARECVTVFPAMLDTIGASSSDGSDEDEGGEDAHQTSRRLQPVHAALHQAVGLLTLRIPAVDLAVLRLASAVGPQLAAALPRAGLSAMQALLGELMVGGGSAGASPKHAKHAALAALALQRASSAADAVALAAQPFYSGLRSALRDVLEDDDIASPASVSSAAAALFAAGTIALAAPLLFLALDGLPVGSDAACADVQAALTGPGAAGSHKDEGGGLASGPAGSLTRAIRTLAEAGRPLVGTGCGTGQRSARSGGGAPASARRRAAPSRSSLHFKSDEDDAGSDAAAPSSDGDDDDDDAGFRRRSAGSKRRRAAAPSPAAAPSSPGRAAGTAAYKGVRAAAPGALVACLALRATAALPRGLAQLHARLLAAEGRGAAPPRAQRRHALASLARAPPEGEEGEEEEALSAQSVRGLASAAAAGAAPVLARALAGGAPGEEGRQQSDAAARTAAAVATLRLAAAGGGLLDAQAITPRHWLATVHVAADGSPPARAAVRVVALSFLRSASLPLRWVALPVLACMDAQAGARKAAKDGLALALLAFRRASAAARQQQQAAAAVAGALPPTAPVLPFALMPEFSLPFALSALAHDSHHYPADAAVSAWLAQPGAGAGSGSGSTPRGGPPPGSASGSASAAPSSAQPGGGGGEGGRGRTPTSAAAHPRGDEGGSSSSGGGGSGAAASGAGNGSQAAGGPLQAQAACLSALIDAILASVPPAAAAAALGAAAAVGDSTQSTTSAAAHAGCLSLLLAIAAKVRECSDAVGALGAAGGTDSTDRVHALADVAFRVLRAKARDQAAFHKYPGEIRLPASLFRPRGSGSVAASATAAGGRGVAVGSHHPRNRPPASAEQAQEPRQRAAVE